MQAMQEDAFATPPPRPLGLPKKLPYFRYSLVRVQLKYCHSNLQTVNNGGKT